MTEEKQVIIETRQETFPTEGSIMEAIPEGRRAYIAAAACLAIQEAGPTSEDGRPTTVVSIHGLRKAIHELARAHDAQELSPRLPDSLAEPIAAISGMMHAVEAMDEEHPESYRIHRAVEPLRSPENRRTAELLVRAALDHGMNHAH